MIGTKQYPGAGVIAVIVFLLLSATFSFAAETITTTYDELNRLTKAEFGSRFKVEYSYDAFGNRSQKKISMLDSSAPNTTIVSKPGSFSTSSVTFTFTSETNATFDCQLDNGAWSACNSGTISYNGLTEGGHTFNVKATDRSGNTDTTPASYTWTVDTIAPDSTITAQPVNPTNSNSANFSFGSTEGGSTFQCSMDSGAYSACTSPKSYTGLTNGSHIFNVKATDTAGNADATPATYTWTIDTVPPDTSITSKPVNPTNSNSASFSFTSTEGGSTFQCSMDSGAYSACTSPKSYTSLTNGSHTFNVKATDTAGNTDATPVTYTWTVDTIAPDTNITAKPVNPTNSNTASFNFTSTEGGSTFQCQLDSGAWTACNSGTASYSGLANGSHTFSVKVTDAAGNADATPATYTWTVDTIAPDTSITSKPVNPTNSNSASFSFTSTEGGSTFQCSMDSGAYSACTSPKSYTGLTDGSHTFNVKATDAAGNTDATPASYIWTVDTSVPNAPLVTGATPTTDTTPTWSWTTGGNGGNGAYRYKLDNSDLNTGATSTTAQSFTPVLPLSAGTHTLYVQERSIAGNWSGSGSLAILIEPTFTISFSFTGSGAMTCTPVTVTLGGSFSCTLYPDGGYYLENLIDNILDVTSLVTNNLYSVGNVTADHTLQAIFQQNTMVLRISGDNNETWYTLIQAAYNAASSTDDILTLASDFYEDLDFNRNVSITIQGGCSPDFQLVTGFTTIHGTLTISDGTIIIENLIMK